MNAAVEALGWTLVHSLWEGALIWVGLQVVFLFLGKNSAQLRYIIAGAALVLSVTAPVVTYFKIELTSTDVAASPAKGPPGISTTNALDPSGPRFTAATAADWTPRLSHEIKGAIPWLVLAWTLGCAWRALRLFNDWSDAKRLVRSPRLLISAGIRARCEDLRILLGIRRTVEIGESILVEAPSVVNWLKPVILMPVGALSGLTSLQVDGILAHELAHVLRNDFAANLLQSVCEVLFYYNPAIQSINRVIRLERERSCDDIAVRLTGDSRSYAEALIQLEERRRPSLAVAATGGGDLLLRIRRLLPSPAERNHREFPFGWTAVASAGLYLVVLVAIPGTVARVRADQPGAASPSSPATAPKSDSRTTLGDLAGQFERAFPYDNNFSSYHTSWSLFDQGDKVSINTIRGNRKQIEVGGSYAVMGTYELASRETAKLGLYVTTPQAIEVRTFRSQIREVSKGKGTFLLWYTMTTYGEPHVSFYPDAIKGEQFGGIYFRDASLKGPVDGNGLGKATAAEPVFKIYLPKEGRVEIGQPIFKSFLEEPQH